MRSETRHFTADHFLQIAGTTPAALTELLDLAAHMRDHPRRYVKTLRGESVACYFEKPSTRTRVSFEVACHRLGALPIMLRPDELQLGRGEPISDTARVLSGYCVAIVARVFSQDTLEQMAAAAGSPVVNALSDGHHPCQALADLLTIRDRFDGLKGVRIAYLGDANNVARSLMEAGAIAGMDVVIASPGGYRELPGVVAAAQAVAAEQGGSVQVTDDPAAAVAGANVVYTDVWVSMGEEAERQRRLTELAGYQVTPDLMAGAHPDAIFMHCLPAHRGQEVAAEVIDGPQSVVFPQAANRLPTEQALLHALVAHRIGDEDDD
jgi:ornithine carbamoyltransferase